MPGARRFSLSTTTKVALGIIVIVAIAAFLYYNPADISLGGGIGGLTDIFSGGGGGERLNFTMSSGESFLKDSLQLEDASLTATGVHKKDTSVGDSLFENADENSAITFEGFRGKMSLKDGVLFIDGTAKSASSEGSRLKPKSGKFSVSAQLVPDSYTVSPVTIDRLSKVTGAIETLGNEEAAAQLSNSSTVDIFNFQGSMDFDGRAYRLSGSATQIKGKSFTLRG